MKQKRIDNEVKRVSVHYQWWKKHLGLEDWHIEVIYFDKPFSKPPKGQRKQNAIYADATCDWQYKRARIRVNLQQIRHMSDQQIEATIVHELMHVRLNEMHNWTADDGTYHEERVATELASAFIWTRYADRDLP